MALSIVTVANSISALDVDGVTIKDLNEIPENADVRGPTIFPRPDGFVSEIEAVRNTFGGASAKWTVSYTLTYRLCHSPIGTGRGLFDVYADMVKVAFAFFDAVIALGVVAGAVDLVLSDAINFGPVVDPAGNPFHGCDISMRVTEFVN